MNVDGTAHAVKACHIGYVVFHQNPVVGRSFDGKVGPVRAIEDAAISGGCIVGEGAAVDSHGSCPAAADDGAVGRRGIGSERSSVDGHLTGGPDADQSAVTARSVTGEGSVFNRQAGSAGEIEGTAVCGGGIAGDGGGCAGDSYLRIWVHDADSRSVGGGGIAAEDAVCKDSGPFTDQDGGATYQRAVVQEGTVGKCEYREIFRSAGI